MKAKYASPRRTEIIAAAGEFRMEDVIPNEGCVITVSHLGFIKRTRVADYRSPEARRQGRHRHRDLRGGFRRAPLHRQHPRLHPFPHQHRPVPREEGLRRPRGHPRLEGQVRLELPPPGRGREDRRHDLREGLRRRAAPRHGHASNGVTKKTNLADYTNATREGGLRGIKLEDEDTPRRLRAHHRRERDRPRQPQGPGRALQGGRPPRPGPRHRRRHRHALQVSTATT